MSHFLSWLNNQVTPHLPAPLPTSFQECPNIHLQAQLTLFLDNRHARVKTPTSGGDFQPWGPHQEWGVKPVEQIATQNGKVQAPQIRGNWPWSRLNCLAAVSDIFLRSLCRERRRRTVLAEPRLTQLLLGRINSSWRVKENQSRRTRSLLNHDAQKIVIGKIRGRRGVSIRPWSLGRDLVRLRTHIPPSKNVRKLKLTQPMLICGCRSDKSQDKGIDHTLHWSDFNQASDRRGALSYSVGWSWVRKEDEWFECLWPT